MARSRASNKGRTAVDPETRFEKGYTVDHLSGCHVWKTSPDARGRVNFFDGKIVLDPRAYLWREVTGQLPETNMRNTCRAKKNGYICVNIDHIIPRGMLRQDKPTRRTLSIEDVQDIRKRYNAGESCVAIAKDYPVSEAAVYKAAKGITYSWVTD